jgi:hypothetical protein
LMPTPDQNEGHGWASSQVWLLELRRRGLSVIMIHHNNKSGAQNGTERRMVPLDTAIDLSRPSGYRASEGARPGQIGGSHETRRAQDADQGAYRRRQEPSRHRRRARRDIGQGATHSQKRGSQRHRTLSAVAPRIFCNRYESELAIFVTALGRSQLENRA